MTFRKLFLPVIVLLISNPLSAQNVTEDQALAWLQEFIRIDTVNPPGNEYRAVEFYARIFDSFGIPYETAESAPGRGNIWARPVCQVAVNQV